MNIIKWINKTNQHANGVCEAATIIWLKKIKKNDIYEANKIKAAECDSLQNKIETGKFTWAIDLISEVEPIKFDAFEGDNLKENGVEKNIDIIFNHLNIKGEFIYISATNLGGHAMAFYRDNNKIYYFDPNNAIYEIDSNDPYEIKTLKIEIIKNCMPWKDVVARYGEL